MSLRSAGSTQVNSTDMPTALTVTASPFIYQNQSIWTQQVLVSGGTVTTLAYSRDGSLYTLMGLLGGMFLISPGDYVRIVYVLPPTVTTINVAHQ